jgi:aldehyde:ferredoxin oxidoreductase
METKRVADLTVEELQAIILQTKRVSDLTAEELKAIITEVVDLRLTYWLNLVNKNPSPVLPSRTKEEQMEINLAAIEWLDKWAEEGDAEEQTETFEYLQKVLDEDRLSSQRLLFQKQ